MRIAIWLLSFWLTLSPSWADGIQIPWPPIGQIPGTATNDSAGAGKVGQIISATVASGSPISLVDGAAKTVTSISLTAGDWDVYGVVHFDRGAGTTLFRLFGSISQTDNTVDFSPGAFGSLSFPAAGTVPDTTSAVTITVPTVPVSVSTTTTIYLTVNQGFTVSTLVAWGSIVARRVR